LLQVFLEGVKAALTADSSFQDGWYEKTPSKGLRAVARVYAGWGFSQAFYWNEVKSLRSLSNVPSSLFIGVQAFMYV
jgi:homoserine O-acetyltransferase